MGSAAGISQVSSNHWRSAGSVIIKNLRYSGFYEQSSDKLLSHLPGWKVTVSRLSWTGREFALEDECLIDYEEGEQIDLPKVQVRFLVNERFEFDRILDYEEVIRQVEEKGKRMNREERRRAVEGLTDRCKEFWSYIGTTWIRNNSSLTREPIKYFGVDCFEMSLHKESSKEALAEFLMRKYEADVVGEVCNILKGKLIVTRQDNKPLYACMRKSTYAEVGKRNKVISEVTEDIIVYVCCWEEFDFLNTDKYMHSELRKLNEVVKYVASEFEDKEKHRIRSKILN